MAASLVHQTLPRLPQVLEVSPSPGLRHKKEKETEQTPKKGKEKTPKKKKKDKKKEEKDSKTMDGEVKVSHHRACGKEHSDSAPCVTSLVTGVVEKDTRSLHVSQGATSTGRGSTTLQPPSAKPSTRRPPL